MGTVMLSALPPAAGARTDAPSAAASVSARVFDVRARSDLADVSSDWPIGGVPEKSRARYHVFQTTTFLDIWMKTFGAARTVSVYLIEVRDISGEPVLYVPLAITRQRGARILTFVDSEMADYNAPVLFPVDWTWTAALADQMLKSIIAALPKFDLLSFDKMPAEVHGLVNPFALIADGADCVSCHAVNLQRPLAEIEAGQPQRKTIVRKMRRLYELAPTRNVIAETEAERSAILDKFIAQKQRRFEETRVPGFDTMPAKEAFFRLGTEAFAKAGMLHFTGLHVGDEIVATFWGLTEGTYYYGLMMSFEGDGWEKHSVGRISYLKTQEWAHAHGFTTLDLGIGDETWKVEHCDIDVPLSRKEMVNSPWGRIFVIRQRLWQRLQALPLWQKLRPYKWTILRALRGGFAEHPVGRRIKQRKG